MRKRSSRLVTFLLLLGGTFGLLLVVRFAPSVLPEEVLSNLGWTWLVLSSFLAFFSNLAGIIEFVQKFAEAPGPLSHIPKSASEFADRRAVAREQRNRDIMIKKVSSFWIKGVLENSLHGNLLLQLGMKYDPNMVDTPWDTVLHVSGKDDELLPKGTQLIEVFDQMIGSLLITGDPGSGKTTALLELAKDLIERARADGVYPIPVVFNLSSWARKRLRFEEWLIDELNTKYQVPVSLAESWVSHDELTLLLDGLDEVKEEYREKCVSAINDFRMEHMVNIVVCSRIHDYNMLSTKLSLHGAVVQLPLTQEQIDSYLRGLGTALEAVRVAVQQDGVLQQLAGSPLVLSIIALAYEGLDVTDLRTGTLEQRRHHLFTTYVNRMFVHRKPRGQFEPATITAGLVWLGQLMRKSAETVFQIENLQPRILLRKHALTTYKWLVRLVFLLVVSIPIGVACGLSVGYVQKSIEIGIVIGVSYGLSGALAMWIAVTGNYGLGRRIVLGVLFGWSIAITAWVFADSILLAAIFGVATTVAIAYGYSRIGSGSLTTTDEDGVESAVKPDAVLTIVTTRKRIGWSWRTGRIGFVKRFPFGLLFGVAGGVAASIPFGWRFGLTAGMALALTFGVGGAISYGMTDRIIGPLSMPNEGIRRSLDNGVRYGLVCGVWLGIAMGFLAALLIGFAKGLMVGFAFFAAGFVVAGVVAGGYAVLQHALLRLLLSLTEGVPFRYAHFLNEAVYHILLRNVGGGYIFVHRLMLEYFAQLDRSNASALPSL